MTYEEFIAHFGTQAAAAEALKVGQTTVSYWKKVGIPRDNQIDIEVATKGALKADLPAQIRQDHAA